MRANSKGLHLILMDIQMPVMDGLTANRAIREELGLVTLPDIALTAGVMAEENQNALNAGINQFLPKPMDLGQMVDMICQYCRHAFMGWTTMVKKGYRLKYAPDLPPIHDPALLFQRENLLASLSRLHHHT